MHSKGTSLDPKKQPSPQPPASALPRDFPDELHDILFRHSGWRDQRNCVYKCLRGSNASVARVARFSDCGHNAYLVRDRAEPTVVAVRAEYCHDRFCVPCNVARSRRTAARVADLCKDKDVRFITLTLAATAEALRDKLNRLNRCFRRLRSHPTWRRHVAGGVHFTEIKRNTPLANWHVHLHALVQGTYFPHALLADIWHTITGDSFVVHVTRPHGASRAASYVAKYLSKPVALAVFADYDLGREVIHALHAKRLCQCFGIWRGQRLNDLPDPHTWDVVCSLAQVRKWASLGSEAAVELLSLLQRQRTCQLSDQCQQDLARAPPYGGSHSDLTESPTVRSASDPSFLDILRWGPEF